MTDDQAELQRRADLLYDRYGKPLEAEHWGEFVAISPGGSTLLGSDYEDLAKNAYKVLGPGNFVFKVGDVAVGNWR